MNQNKQFLVKFLLFLYLLLSIYSQNQTNKKNEDIQKPNITYSEHRVLSQESSKQNRESVCKLLGDEVEDGQVVSEAQRESWYFNKQSMRRFRDKNALEPFFKGESINFVDLGMSLKLVIFFVLFFVFSLFSCLLYYFCHYCGDILCGCCCKKRNKLYVGIDLHWPILGSVCCFFVLFCVSIYGLGYSTGLENSFNTFICTGLTAFDGLAYGGGEFAGVLGIMGKLENFIKSDLGLIQTKTSETFTGEPEWVNLEKLEMDYINQAMLEPCPATGCEECTGQTYTGTKPPEILVKCAPNSWDPYFIDSYNYVSSGSSLVSNFFGTDIWRTQVEASQTLYSESAKGIREAIQAIEDAGKNINDQTGSMQSNIQSGVDQMKGMETDLTSQMDSLKGYHTDYSSILQLVSLGVNTLLWSSIFLSLFGCFLIFVIEKKGWLKLRCILHLYWMFFSLFMIISFLLTVILLLISSFGEQGCEVMNKMFNDPEFFDAYSAEVPKDLKDKIVICKKELNLITSEHKGDDNLSKAFNIDEQLSSIEDLKKQIKQFDEKAGVDSPNMKTLESVPDNLDQIIANIETMKASFHFETIPDLSSLPATLSSINTAISSCYTNINQYVTSLSECDASATQTDFTTAATTDNDYCFWVGNSVNYDNVRYGSCSPNPQADIQQVENWRDEKDKMCNLKKIQTENLKAQLQQYISLQKTYISSVSSFTDTVFDALETIAGEKGIVNSIKCFWFGTQIDNFYDAVCVSFINSTYNIGFVFGLFSMSIFFNSFFLYTYSQRQGFNAKKKTQIEAAERKKAREYSAVKDQTQRGNQRKKTKNLSVVSTATVLLPD